MPRGAWTGCAPRADFKDHLVARRNHALPRKQTSLRFILPLPSLALSLTRSLSLSLSLSQHPPRSSNGKAGNRGGDRPKVAAIAINVPDHGTFPHLVWKASEWVDHFIDHATFSQNYYYIHSMIIYKNIYIYLERDIFG